jgi:hypothetical protein
MTLAIVLWVAKRPKPPVRARAIGAELDLAAGEVTVDEAGHASRVGSGTALAIGARIATGKGSRALVRSSDGAAIFLRGESAIVLEPHGFEVLAASSTKPPNKPPCFERSSSSTRCRSVLA